MKSLIITISLFSLSLSLDLLNVIVIYSSIVRLLWTYSKSIRDSPRSYSNVHPAAEAGAAVSSPRGPAEAQGAQAEAAGGGGRPGRKDEETAGGQREQTETAGGYEEGNGPCSTIKT